MKKILFLLLILFFNACAKQKDERMHLLVSLMPQKYLLDRLGGDRVEVQVMIQAGQSPELFEPSPGQILGLARVRLYFLAGMPSEELWLGALKESFPDLKLLDTTRGIERILMEDTLLGNDTAQSHTSHEHGTYDPHTWTSPRLFLHQARLMLNTLVEVDSQNAAYYYSNFTFLQQDLVNLDKALEQKFQGLQGRSFVVFHPAWAYLARDYGLRQLSIEIEGREPGAEEILRIMDILRKSTNRVIFVQPQENPRAATVLAEQTGARVETLDPLRYDYLININECADKIAQALRGKL